MATRSLSSCSRSVMTFHPFPYSGSMLTENEKRATLGTNA